MDRNIDKINKPVKVLMVVPNLHVSNGVATFAMNYYRSLCDGDAAVDFALLSDMETPYYKEIRERGSRIIVLPSFYYYPDHVRKCREIFRETDYDVIHDSSLLKTLPIMAEAKAAGVPLRILHSHAAQMGETRFKEIRNRLLLPALKRYANSYMACSEAAGKAMFGDSAFIVVPNVISESNYHFDSEVRARVRAEMGVGSDDLIVATVGRPSYQKNPFFAVDVMTEFLKSNSNARYWWIGSGPLDEQLRQYIIGKGMDGRIVFLGSRNDVAELYQAMDVFFLPSLFEGLPLVGVEAQAMGLPSLLSDSITKELIYTDLVVMESLSSPAKRWCERLEELSALRPDRASYSGILENSAFSSEGAGKRLSGLYEKLLMEKGGSPKA